MINIFFFPPPSPSILLCLTAHRGCRITQPQSMAVNQKRRQAEKTFILGFFKAASLHPLGFDITCIPSMSTLSRCHFERNQIKCLIYYVNFSIGIKLTLCAFNRNDFTPE